MNKKKPSNGAGKVLLNSGFYVFSALLVDAVGFFLLPIYLLFLSTEEYGKVTIANGFVDVAVILAVFSLHMAIARFYADYKNDKEKVATYFCTLLVFSLASSTVFSILCFLLRPFLENKVFSGIDFYPVIFLVIISLPFRVLRNIHRYILRGTQNGGELALVNLIVFIAQAGFVLLFIGPMDMGAEGMLLAALIVHVLYSIFVIIDLKVKGLLKFSYNFEMLKSSLKYSVPIMPHNLSTYIATLVSRVVLNGWFGITTVGLFGVASQFGTVVDTIESSSNNALTPWFFDYKNDKDGKVATIRSLTKAFCVFFGFCILGLGLFAKEIIIILTKPEYLDAWKVIVVLVIAYAVKVVYYLYLNVLLYYKEGSKKLFVGTVSGNLLNVFVAVLLTPYIGMYGPAVALIAAQLLIAFYVYKVSRKYDTESFKLSHIIRVLVIASGLAIAGNALGYFFYEGSISLVDVSIKIALIVGYVVFSYFANKKEIEVLIRKLKNRKKGKRAT